jgi:lysyl-tRNA synthetase class 2
VSESSEYEISRREKLRKIEELGLDPWGHRFDGHMPIQDVLALPADKPDDQRPPVKVAGRIVSRRIKGKVHFLDLWDWSGQPTRRVAAAVEGKHEATEYTDWSSRVQVFLGQKQVGETGWALAQELDLGDFLGVEGTFGKTKTGEPTIFAEKLTFLGKSLLPHPDKWSGMQEMEFRLRHRYLDLIYNPEMFERALKRIKILRRIRAYLDERGYVEVETPTLHAIAGGAAARPFVTHHNALDIDLYLRIALELHLKRLLVGGVEKVYEIGRVFRNEGISPRHNPEFTMMELYQAYGNYETMMDLTEGLIVACVKACGESMTLPYGERAIDFTPPFERRRYADLFRDCVGTSIDDHASVLQAAKDRHLQTSFEVKAADGTTTRAEKDHDVLVHELFEHCVEPRLAQSDRPVFVYDYPAGLCPLTKRKRDNPAIAERFELYVLGMELANAYTELNDPITQEATFRQQLAGLPEEDSMAKMDEDFVRALRHGMPPAGGLGVGIDRLVMLLTNTTTIRDVILFPLLRPVKSPRAALRSATPHAAAQGRDPHVQAPPLLALPQDALPRVRVHHQRDARRRDAHRRQQRHERVQRQAPRPPARPALRHCRRGLRHGRLRRRPGAHGEDSQGPRPRRQGRGDDGDDGSLRHAPVPLPGRAGDHPARQGPRRRPGIPVGHRRVQGIPR